MQGKTPIAKKDLEQHFIKMGQVREWQNPISDHTFIVPPIKVSVALFKLY